MTQTISRRSFMVAAASIPVLGLTVSASSPPQEDKGVFGIVRVSYFDRSTGDFRVRTEEVEMHGTSINNFARQAIRRFSTAFYIELKWTPESEPYALWSRSSQDKLWYSIKRNAENPRFSLLTT